MYSRKQHWGQGPPVRWTNNFIHSVTKHQKNNSGQFHNTNNNKKSHSFLNKLLSVWGSNISKGQFTNKFGFVLANGTAFGCSHNNILALLEKEKTKQKPKPPWSDFTSRRAPKQMQDNKEHAGATRLLNATIYVLKLAVPRYHVYQYYNI